jgi:hypothetical protein
MSVYVSTADFVVNGQRGRPGGGGDNPICFATDTMRVAYPPTRPADIASKIYVDSSFPSGEGFPYCGEYQNGTLNFSTPNTPLYNATGANAVRFEVNRVGIAVTLQIPAFSTTATAVGNLLIGSGLPSQFWPVPVFLGDSGAVITNPFFILTVGSTGNNDGYIGIGSDGNIYIGTTDVGGSWGIGDTCAWNAGGLSYLTWRGNSSS